jgi:hypothetical protein
MAAEDVLRAPVTREGGNSRLPRLMPIVESRLRRMFTEGDIGASTGSVVGAPELRPKK